MAVTTQQKILNIIPLRGLFIFPNNIKPIIVGRSYSVHSIQDSLEHRQHIVLATQKRAEEEEIRFINFFTTGIKARILKAIRMEGNTYKVLIEGLNRVRIKDIFFSDQVLRCAYQGLPIRRKVPQGYEDFLEDIYSLYNRYAEKKRVSALKLEHETGDNPGRLLDMIAAKLPISASEQYLIINAISLAKRADLVYEFLYRENERLDIKERIKNRIKDRVEESQKQFFLNEQIKAIKQEMGQEESDEDELLEIKKQIEASPMSVEAKEKGLKELKRLQKLPFLSAEVGVIRNYLDWLLALPWKKKKRERIDLKHAKKILDDDHYGLDKIKERIIEHLAIRKLSRAQNPTILCFVGPPGTGKTSLSKSIARATNREFVRVSLGGTRDEAEIRGHRVTYVGSMPGRIIQSMRKVKSINPVFLLDEIDKLGMDFRGDPASALLEVLDPDQNKHFSDHFLEVEYDLSQVMFITTANNYTIPKPLLDRMEVLELEGYTDVEKLEIAKHFLLPKELKFNGLTAEKLVFSDAALLEIIHKYTREAGVRNLQREIGRLLRKLARKKVEEKRKLDITITSKDVRKLLGVAKFQPSPFFKGRAVGEATGLAWTTEGGDVLSIEVILTQGQGNIIMTGNLKTVMKESAKTALSYVKSRLKQQGKEMEDQDIHIHLPEGAIPKEGPSAGITLATAIFSAFSKKRVNKEIAMTGEITLKGRVLPVGGIKTKLLGAVRRDIADVIIPDANQKDLADLPDAIRDKLTIHTVASMDDVFSLVIPN